MPTSAGFDVGGASFVVPKALLSALYLFWISGRIRNDKKLRAASFFFDTSGIQRARSTFTRTFRSAGSFVTGSGKVPTASFGSVLAISLSAHGPCRYIAAAPFAKARFPSP